MAEESVEHCSLCMREHSAQPAAKRRFYVRKGDRGKSNDETEPSDERMNGRQSKLRARH
jgi:hypothetical protein